MLAAAVRDKLQQTTAELVVSVDRQISHRQRLQTASDQRYQQEVFGAATS